MKHFYFKRFFLFFFYFQANLFASDFTEEEISQIDPKVYRQLENAESEEKFLSILKRHAALKATNISHPPVIIAFIKNYLLRLDKEESSEKIQQINIGKIVTAGVPINQKGPDGNTALHRIVAGEKLLKMDGRKEDCLYLRYHQHIVLELLLYKPDLTTRNNNGHTVLELALAKDPLCNKIILDLTSHLAASRSTLESISFIANEPMFIEKKWRAPLAIVLKYVSGLASNEIIENLLKMGAEIKSADALYYLYRSERHKDLDGSFLTKCPKEILEEAQKLFAQWKEQVALAAKKRKASCVSNN